jgi:3-oxoacyl-(acyl-carrier-protein) synthase
MTVLRQAQQPDSIFVLSAKQISMQQPLSEEWMDNPIMYDVPFTRSIDPSFKEYISPIEARRMGRILKRALATSKEALKAAGCDTVDAIMTGTGFGCIENTEFFLDALSNEGEQLLKPTYFMQSTHNTISSLVAIQTKNYNYNATYAHKGISFESALHDAWLQFRLGKIGSALVGCHDEMTETFHSIMKKGGVMGQDDERCGEVAVSVVLSNNPVSQDVEPVETPSHSPSALRPFDGPQGPQALCRLTGLKMLHQPTMNNLMDAVTTMLQSADRSLADVDYILTGISGNHENDKAYLAETKTLFGDKPLLKYKHLFGENFTASGLGFYVAAQCLKAGRVPSHLFVNANEASDKQPACIMLFNRSDGNDYTLILLET